eukprot:1879053-Rhodomonas_salina.1
MGACQNNANFSHQLYMAEFLSWSSCIAVSIIFAIGPRSGVTSLPYRCVRPALFRNVFGTCAQDGKAHRVPRQESECTCSQNAHVQSQAQGAAVTDPDSLRRVAQVVRDRERFERNEFWREQAQATEVDEDVRLQAFDPSQPEEVLIVHAKVSGKPTIDSFPAAQTSDCEPLHVIGGGTDCVGFGSYVQQVVRNVSDSLR